MGKKTIKEGMNIHNLSYRNNYQTFPLINYVHIQMRGRTFMHFNKSIVFQKESSLLNVYDNKQFVAIDTVSIDDHSRFIFTKKLKKISCPASIHYGFLSKQSRQNNNKYSTRPKCSWNLDMPED